MAFRIRHSGETPSDLKTFPLPNPRTEEDDSLPLKPTGGRPARKPSHPSVRRSPEKKPYSSFTLIFCGRFWAPLFVNAEFVELALTRKSLHVRAKTIVATCADGCIRCLPQARTARLLVGHGGDGF